MYITISLSLSLSPDGLPISVPGGHYPAAQSPTLFSSPACNGSETNFLSCLNTSNVGTASCHGNKHVGVICPGKSRENFEFRKIITILF